MASVNWEKYKTAIEVKAHIRHNEKQCREQTKEHNNQHIDKTKSCYNYSLLHRSYEERCKIYDDIIADIQTHSKKTLRKDAVTCLSLETAVPEQLSEDKIQAWFLSYHRILCNFFGQQNILDTDVHFDEQHEYIDPETHKKTMSRVHAHTLIVPCTSDRRLCCKEISSRKNIVELNRQIEEMSQREYGVQFNNGKTARKKSVEQLKAESLKLEISANQETLKTQAEIMQKAPKKRIFKKSDYHMSEQEHNEWLDFGETIKHSVNNALACDKKEKEISKRLDEIKKLKERQEQLIAERAEQRARQLANNALLTARKKEQEAEQEKQKAKQAKQDAERIKQEYITLKQNTEKYINQKAMEKANKISATFRSLDMKRKFTMLEQSRIDTVQAPQKAYDDEYYK